MTAVTHFTKAQETYARLEANSITSEIQQVDVTLDDWDMADQSAQTLHDLDRLDRRRAALVVDYETLTDRKYPERGPQ